MKPTQGRTVIYTQPKAEPPCNGRVEHPAIVTATHGDDYVNLVVFFDASPSAPITSVPLKGSALDAGSGRTWHWPARQD